MPAGERVSNSQVGFGSLSRPSHKIKTDKVETQRKGNNKSGIRIDN